MLLINMVTIALAIITAFSVIYVVTANNIAQENENWLVAMSSRPIHFDDTAVVDPAQTVVVPDKFNADYRVSFALDIDDGVITNIDSHLDMGTDFYETALAQIESDTSGQITLEGRTWAYQVSEVNPLDPTEIIAVFLDVTANLKTLNDLLMTLVGVGIGVLALLLWFSYRFTLKAVSPIEESYNKQKQFITDASHEFKTPLAIISANLEAIEISPNETVASQQEWFGYIKAELLRARKLVDQLLLMAKMENQGPAMVEVFDLSRACNLAGASMEAVYYENDISLDTRITPDIRIIGDGQGIVQILYVLLDNAGKYTPANGSVSFTLDNDHDWAVIKIANTSMPIAQEDLLKIFDRFYRLDASRSQETGGFGLGLFIAKTIVERAGGKIAVTSLEGITTFTVKLKHI